MKRPREQQRKIMAWTGVIPAIAIMAGLLSVPETSALRAMYWPWLPLLALVIGVAGSLFFWLWLAPRMDKKRGKPD